MLKQLKLVSIVFMIVSAVVYHASFADQTDPVTIGTTGAFGNDPAGQGNFTRELTMKGAEATAIKVKPTRAKVLQGEVGETPVVEGTVIISATQSAKVADAIDVQRGQANILIRVVGDFVRETEGGNNGQGANTAIVVVDRSDWKTHYNKGNARVLLEINGEGVNDDYVSEQAKGGMLHVSIVGGNPGEEYSVVLSDIALDTGDVGFGEGVVTLRGPYDQKPVTLSGLAKGKFRISATCLTAVGSQRVGEVIGRITRIELTGPDSALHGETKSYSVKAFSGETDITNKCLFQWTKIDPGFKRGNLSGYELSAPPVPVSTIGRKWRIMSDGELADGLYRDLTNYPGKLEVKAHLGSQISETAAKWVNVGTGKRDRTSGLARVTGAPALVVAAPFVGNEAFFEPSNINPPPSGTETLRRTISVTAEVNLTLSFEIKQSASVDIKFVTAGVETTLGVSGTVGRSQTWEVGYETGVEYTAHPIKWTHCKMNLSEKKETVQYDVIEYGKYASGLELMFKLGTAESKFKSFIVSKSANWVDQGPATNPGG